VEAWIAKENKTQLGWKDLDQLAQKGCGNTVFGDFQTFTGHGSEQDDPVLSRGLHKMIFRSHFRPNSFCAKILLIWGRYCK